MTPWLHHAVGLEIMEHNTDTSTWPSLQDMEINTKGVRMGKDPQYSYMVLDAAYNRAVRTRSGVVIARW